MLVTEVNMTMQVRQAVGCIFAIGLSVLNNGPLNTRCNPFPINNLTSNSIYIKICIPH